MIELKNTFTFCFTTIDNIHNKVSPESLETLPTDELIELGSTLENIHQTAIIILNSQEFDQFSRKPEFPIFCEDLKKYYEILLNDKQKIKFFLLLRGVGVNQPIQTYLEKYPLKDRVLILGCGHHRGHSHVGAYCLDNCPDAAPDAPIDVASPLMNYIPSGSFSKIILENLPTEIFNDNRWQLTFNHLHRILAKEGGEVEFNSMLGLNVDEDFDNVFNLAVSSDEMNSLSGKRITDLPELCIKYNERLKKCFASVNLHFSKDFDMASIPKSYTIYKLNPTQEGNQTAQLCVGLAALFFAWWFFRTPSI